LDILRYGKVAFKNASDAENTLTLCEDLDLPFAEEQICRILKKKPRKQRQESEMTLETGTEGIRLNQDCPEGGFQNDGVHKRTYQLSNGEEIWDMEGNVLRWVADTLTSNGNGGQEYEERDVP
jgi:hypothetical protein